MEGRNKGISAFARQSLQSKPRHNNRSSRKRLKMAPSLQHDVDSIIDSSDSCHSDSSEGISRKRKFPLTNTSHHHVMTPYDKVRHICSTHNPQINSLIPCPLHHCRHCHEIDSHYLPGHIHNKVPRHIFSIFLCHRKAQTLICAYLIFSILLTIYGTYTVC